MALWECIKIILISIVEGITEWLPISSTGHMLLLDNILDFEASDAFKEVFFIVVQLGAVLAVVLLFWQKMWLWRRENGKTHFQKSVGLTWCKVALACIPGAVATLLLDDFVERTLSTPVVIAVALIVYGVAFLLVRGKEPPRVNALEEVSFRDALMIGLFQVLSIIPGTSRSGATILGGLCLGVSRPAAAEFTFFLAVPAMAGLSLVKLVKLGFAFSAAEWATLVLGAAVAFLTSLLVVRRLMAFIKKHDFAPFGWYRIALGLIVLITHFAK